MQLNWFQWINLLLYFQLLKIFFQFLRRLVGQQFNHQIYPKAFRYILLKKNPYILHLNLGIFLYFSIEVFFYRILIQSKNGHEHRTLLSNPILLIFEIPKHIDAVYLFFLCSAQTTQRKLFLGVAVDINELLASLSDWHISKKTTINCITTTNTFDKSTMGKNKTLTSSILNLRHLLK